MEFEVKAEEASDINVKEMVARLTAQRKLMTASTVTNNAATQTIDLMVTKVPAAGG
jgi:hypothetical protein